VLASAVALSGLVVGVSPAAAKEACWKQVVQDWYADGRIDGIYSASCLNKASQNLPEDVKQYSSFDDQAKRARQKAVRNPASVGSTGRQGEDLRSGLFRDALDKTSPRNADSMPLPLLILGGLALLLIASGAVGVASKRLRARRVRGG
jgi:hypothetical protein